VVHGSVRFLSGEHRLELRTGETAAMTQHPQVQLRKFRLFSEGERPVVASSIGRYRAGAVSFDEQSEAQTKKRADRFCEDEERRGRAAEAAFELVC